MKDIIFREYDIRGIVGSEFLLDETYSLAQAIAFYFVQKHPKIKSVVIGMDGRTHSPKIKEACVQAFKESGIDVIFIGVCPTPAMYFSLFTLPVDAGLMITASHNPGEYNGIKICLQKQSVWGKQIQAIKQLYKASKHVVCKQMGNYSEYNIIEPYISFLAENFNHLKGYNIPFIIDCANGAGGTVIPKLVQQMDWSNAMILYSAVDGSYPNHEADPTVEKNMEDIKHLLEKQSYAFGVGLDGDCDRMGAMTKKGFLIPGDMLLGLFAQQLVKTHPGSTVVFDVKASSGLIEYLQKCGANPHISPSGHAIIKEHMHDSKALLAGELSCHFFFKDTYFGYDDGIYALLRLIDLLVQTGQTLDQLCATFPRKCSSKEFRIACKEEDKLSIIQTIKKAFEARDDVDMITIDGIRATAPYGWGLVRPSNTQSVMCFRFESDTSNGLKRIKQDFVTLIKPFFTDAQMLNMLNS